MTTGLIYIPNSNTSDIHNISRLYFASVNLVELKTVGAKVPSQINNSLITHRSTHILGISASRSGCAAGPSVVLTDNVAFGSLTPLEEASITSALQHRPGRASPSAGVCSYKYTFTFSFCDSMKSRDLPALPNLVCVCARVRPAVCVHTLIIFNDSFYVCENCQLSRS